MRLARNLAVLTVLIHAGGAAAIAPSGLPAASSGGSAPGLHREEPSVPLEARLADLLHREEAVAARPWEVVLREVGEQAAALGISAPLDELTRLLFQRARLELVVERCSLNRAAGAACDRARKNLQAVEAEFLSLAGISAAEFRRGRRVGDLEQRAAPLLGEGGSTRTDPSYCRCDVTVSNYDRWMNRWWGLECACHSGHGVCSNNLDWCGIHSPGAGAMTGSISLGFGQEWRSRGCPDDHRTCFKGPMPSTPGGGEWTNVCNCDTVHSQFSNPLAGFFGGDVSDAPLVTQASFSGVVSDGPCFDQGMGVYEFIEEHDPVCCDDPMGTLSASLRVFDGTTTADVPASAQNCNGGSQSGVPPYCGTFGATIRIQASCQTLPDDPFGSCWGRCGELLPDASCNCDFGCQYEGDCCWDYCDACSAPGDQPPFPCDVGGQ